MNEKILKLVEELELQQKLQRQRDRLEPCNNGPIEGKISKKEYITLLITLIDLLQYDKKAIEHLEKENATLRLKKAGAHLNEYIYSFDAGKSHETQLTNIKHFF